MIALRGSRPGFPTPYPPSDGETLQCNRQLLASNAWHTSCCRRYLFKFSRDATFSQDVQQSNHSLHVAASQDPCFGTCYTFQVLHARQSDRLLDQDQTAEEARSHWELHSPSEDELTKELLQRQQTRTESRQSHSGVAELLIIVEMMQWAVFSRTHCNWKALRQMWTNAARAPWRNDGNAGTNNKTGNDSLRQSAAIRH